MKPNLNWLVAILRIELRSLRRSAKRTFLIGSLIGIPVAAIVFTSNLLFVTEMTPDEAATARMGAADLRVDSFFGPDEIKKQLPQGSVLESLSFGSEELLVNNGARKVHTARINFDGLAKGMAKILDGRAPKSASEVAATARLLALCQKKIGDSIDLSVGGPVSIVGIVEFPESLNQYTVFYAYVPDVQWGRTEWIVDLPPPVSDHSEQMDTTPFDACSKRSDLLKPQESDIAIVFLFGGFAFAIAALIVSAAFIVGIRRRQREMGLLAASGGSPFHVLSSVIVSACVIAIVAGAVGALLGLVFAGIVHPWLDSINGRRNGAFEIAWMTHFFTIVAGVITGVMSAFIPALAASRIPVKQALSSRRPTPKSSSKWALVGCAMVILGIVLVGAAPLMLKTEKSSSSDNNSILSILCGSILGIVGFGLCSPQLLALIARLASWMPLSWRLAVRETGRFRTRNGPIITAILASLSLSVLFGTVYQSVRNLKASTAPILISDPLMLWEPESALVSPQIEGPESDSLLWSLLLASIGLGLSVIAIATALAGEEAKCDQRILTTVGAPPTVYRNQASARSGLLALIGSWLSIPAGVLPAYGIISLIPSLEFTFPWAEVAVITFGLPFLAYSSTWMILRIKKPRSLSEMKPTVY